jgi:uncharacterized protein (TIGR03437 family)
MRYSRKQHYRHSSARSGVNLRFRIVPGFFPVLFFWLCLAAQAQNVITTLAGSPHLFSPGSPAATTSIAPSRLIVGPNGDVYFGDRESNLVLKLTGGSLAVVAGNGIAGYSGDGGPATSASLNQPSGFAIDRGGNLYIADVRNARVRKVDTHGIITTVAGNGHAGFSGDGGPAVAASLGWNGGTTLGTNGGHVPAQYYGGIAVDSQGILYIADTENGRVRKVDSNGIITTLINSSADQLAVDSAGNLYLSGSSGNSVIQKLAPGGTLTTVFASGAVIALTVSPDDVLYAAGFGQILKIANGTPTIIFEPPSNVFGIGVSQNGNVFLSEPFDERVWVLNRQGTVATVAAGTGAPNYFGDGGPAAAAGLSLSKLLASGSNLALDSEGVLYIADTTNSRIRRVKNGVITTVADFSSGSNGIKNPYSVTVLPDGSILAAEWGKSIVRIGSDGNPSTFAGAGSTPPADGVPASSARLGVTGLSADSFGNVYLLDSLTLRRIDPSGIIRTVGKGFTAPVLTVDKAGNVFLPASNSILKIAGDGSAATIPIPAGMVSQITGLAVDSAGNIYISDSGNHSRILKLTPAGAASVYAGNNAFAYGGDGGLASAGSIFGPTGLAIDDTATLYIADSYNDRVRKVVSTTTISFNVSSNHLDFNASAGGTPPPSQSINLSSTLPGISFAATSNASWLSATPANGAMPASLVVTASPTGLSPGPYQGTILITAPNAIPSTAAVTVTFVVDAPMPPKLNLSSTYLSFDTTQGSPPKNAQVQVQNVGGGVIGFTAKAVTGPGLSWLTVTPKQGAVTPTTPATLNVAESAGVLTPGTYFGNISVDGFNPDGTVVSVSISVVLSVTAPAARILLSQSGLQFNAASQGGSPLPQSFGILNIGGGSMDWSCTAATLSGGNWLRVSPASGTLARPYLDVSQVDVAVDPTGLAPGDYYGKVQVSAGADNSPQSMTIILTVLPAGISPGPEIRPSALIFTGVAGSSPGSQDVMIGNPASQPDTFLSGQIGAGYSYLPTTASVLPNQPATLRVFPDFSNLPPGTHQNGVITLLFSGNTPRTVTVLMVVAPAGLSPGLATQAAGCASSNLEVQLRSPSAGSPFSALAGAPVTIAAQVVDDCGNLLGADGSQTGSVVASFTNKDGDVSLTHIGNGVWTGTWLPVNTANGQVTMTVTASNSTPTVQQSGSVTVSGTVGPGATPAVNTTGVVQAASFVSGAPISPGSLITIFGSNLAAGQQDASLTAAFLGNLPLPVLYADNAQMNVLVPYEIPDIGQTQLTIQRGSVLSVPRQLVISSAQPGVFTVNQQGTGPGDIYKSDNTTLAQDENRACVGETLAIYATGLGRVDPPVPTGTLAPQYPLSKTVNDVKVTIDGRDAGVVFAGLTPGTEGLYQVNAVVPDGVDTGAANEVPVILTTGGVSSPAAVTIRRPGPKGGTPGVCAAK